MPVVSALILILFSPACFAESKSVVAEIHHEKSEFSVRAKDKRGFTREYAVQNQKDFIYDLVRLDGKRVAVDGDFKESGLRTGTLKIKKIGDEIVDPLDQCGANSACK